MPDKKQSNFTLSFSERRWLLILLDLTAIISGFILSLIIRPDYEFSWQLIVDNPGWIILLIVLWSFVGYFFQVYDLEKAGEFRVTLPAILGAGFILQVVYNAIPYLAPVLPPSRQPLFLAVLIPTAFLFFGRVVYILVFSSYEFRRRLVIVGAGWAGKTIYKTIKEHGSSLYQIIGFIDDDAEMVGSTVLINEGDCEESGEISSDAKVIGKGEDLYQIIKDRGVTTIILAITHDVTGEMYQYLADCLQLGVEIISMPVIYEQLTGKVPVEHIGDHWAVSMPLEHPGTRILWHAVKRVFDIVWSIIGLLGLAILFPIIALAILIDSPGPLIYTQTRLGRNGKEYKVYKFRSMIPDAEKGKAIWAKKDDSRITRVGKLLRKTHLDEFPQFLNILKGEMSVVGPRPERPEFVESLVKEIPFYRVRLAVKPGMAGWGLINQGYGSSREDALVKLQYDLYYIKHQSLWLDLYILTRTIIDSLTFGGR